MGPEYDPRIPVRFNGEEIDLVQVETYDPTDDIPSWFDGYPKDLEVDLTGFVTRGSHIIGLLVHRRDKTPLFVSCYDVVGLVRESLQRRHPLNPTVQASEPAGESKL